MAVATGSIRENDIVEVNIKGRVFLAYVESRPARDGNGGGLVLAVRPVHKGVSYRNVRTRDLTKHYKLLGRPKQEA